MSTILIRLAFGVVFSSLFRLYASSLSFNLSIYVIV